MDKGPPARIRTRLIAQIAAVLLAATAAVLLVGAPAQAATCGPGTNVTVTKPTAATSFNWVVCSDHSVVIRNARVSDNNCDDRSAEVTFWSQYKNSYLVWVNRAERGPTCTPRAAGVLHDSRI